MTLNEADLATVQTAIEDLKIESRHLKNVETELLYNFPDGSPRTSDTQRSLRYVETHLAEFEELLDSIKDVDDLEGEDESHFQQALTKAKRLLGVK